MSDFTFETLDRWPYAGTGDKRAPFKANYNKTVAQFKSEMEKAGTRSVVIQTGHHGEDIRMDGLPRVNARKPRFPGVCVIFEKWVPNGEFNDEGDALGIYTAFEFPCATFDHWEDNLRAIVLTLDALRRVARYGVSGTGSETAGATEEAKQYEGFARKKIEARTDMPTNGATLSREAAANVLAACAGGGWSQATLLSASAEEVKRCYKQAAQNEHPDAGGSQETFVRIGEALKVLTGGAT